MSGVLGDFLVVVGRRESDLAMSRLLDAEAWPPTPERGAEIRYESPSPDVHVWRRGSDARMQAAGPLGGIGMALDPPAWEHADGDRAATTISAWLRDRTWRPDAHRGRFAYVCWNATASHVRAATDAFRSCPLYVHAEGGGIAIATDLRLIVRAGLSTRRVRAESIYHYLNFSYVPAPYCAFEGVSKLAAGHALEWSGGGELASRRYWDARYPADRAGSEADRADALRERMIDTVRRYGPASAEGWGTFLSGGTDSSSIASILSIGRDSAPVNSFSIGFEEAGYDELGFSRIASGAFGLRAHERRVGEAESVALLPRLARCFDEPFGNSSAIPTHFCAELAALNDVRLLVAGDGGDEIFGGNERYRKDAIFERYHRLPPPLRWLGDRMAGALESTDARFANRVKNFVRRASLPNPDRFYTDDSFASDHFETLLDPGFRARVGRDDSLAVQRRVFAEGRADADLHRLMYLDLNMTIADNDVVKVVRATRMAGVDVAFPYLDRDLVDFTGSLPASDKVRGLEKRHLFKLATREILPEAIRRKKKQGFGLPVSVWLTRKGGPMHALMHEVVLSPRALARGYFQASQVRRLIERHERGAWDHASEIYLLLMLELWHREHVDEAA